MKIYLALSLPLFLIYSCKNKVEKLETTDKIDTQKTVSIDSFYIDEDEINGGSRLNEYFDDTKSITLNYPEFTVSFYQSIVFDRPEQVAKLIEDTVVLSINHGETIEDQPIKLSYIKLDNVKVEQAYQTSVTVMNEGPHCDLLDWKHYTSAWEDLYIDAGLVCHTNNYTPEQREQFPKVTSAELRRAIKEHCNEEWFKLIGIDNTISVNKEPCAVGISSYLIRIGGIQPQTGKKIVKLIIFENPLGC